MMECERWNKTQPNKKNNTNILYRLYICCEGAIERASEYSYFCIYLVFRFGREHRIANYFSFLSDGCFSFLFHSFFRRVCVSPCCVFCVCLCRIVCAYYAQVSSHHINDIGNFCAFANPLRRARGYPDLCVCDKMTKTKSKT